MACWIAVTVAILGIAAVLQGGRREDWIGTFSFLAMSCAIWLAGRVILFVSRDK
jgi:uncharacterized membrane protein